MTFILIGLLVLYVFQCISYPILTLVIIPPVVGCIIIAIVSSISKRRRNELIQQCEDRVAQLEKECDTEIEKITQKKKNDQQRKNKIKAIEDELRQMQAQADKTLKAAEEEYDNVCVFRPSIDNASYLADLIECMETGRADTIADAINRVKEDYRRRTDAWGKMIQDNFNRKIKEEEEKARREREYAEARRRREHEKRVEDELRKIRYGE